MDTKQKRLSRNLRDIGPEQRWKPVLTVTRGYTIKVLRSRREYTRMTHDDVKIKVAGEDNRVWNRREPKYCD